MNLGIHKFADKKGTASYFVQRRYGNYLLFSENCDQYNYEFIKSKGGIYKQFIENTDDIKESQGKLFDIYGAAAVGHFSPEPTHPRLPLEAFNKDFIDKEIRFPEFENRKHILLKQMSKKVVFFGKAYYLRSDGRVFVNTQDHTQKLHQFFIEQGISYAFFSHFQKAHLLHIEHGKVYEKDIH